MESTPHQNALIFYARAIYYLFEYIFQLWRRILFGRRTYQEEDMNGKMAIVTGANCGLGKATVFELARRGATVVMAGRDSTKLSEAAADIRSRTPNGELDTMILDLADLKSVKKFATSVVGKYSRVDILINNAGVVNGGAGGNDLERSMPTKTADGFELHFGTNYLGPFYLTNLLLDHLKKSTESRIINVTSGIQAGANLNIDDLMSEHQTPDHNLCGFLTQSDFLYANSKLANSYFTKELTRRLQGTNVTSYTVCPGAAMTKLFRSQTRFRQIIFSIGLNSVGLTPERGCETIVYCAISKDCVQNSGRLFRFCRLLKSMERLFCNDAFSEELWKASASLVTATKQTQDFGVNNNSKE